MLTFGKKIPITIHPLFWLISIFIGWIWTSTITGALICVVVIVGSVLVHEFGHALTAVAFGQKTRIELAAFGGFTYRQGGKLKLWKEFLVVLNGPLAGFSLFVLAYLVFRYIPITNSALLFLVKFTFIANLFWTVINLVPVLPLDGGHLLSIILESIFGFKGIKMAIMIGLVIAIAISVGFFIIGQFLVGALFLILTFEGFRSLRYYKIFNEKDRDEGLQKTMTEAQQARAGGNLSQALEIYESIRQKTQKGILYTVATQEMAQIYKEQREYEKAYHLLLPIKKNLDAHVMPLMHFLAYVNGDLKTTLALGAQCYQVNPTYETALINACANASLGQIKPSVGWLECCVRDQIPSITEACSRSEFDLIRETPEFQSFLSKVS